MNLERYKGMVSIIMSVQVIENFQKYLQHKEKDADSHTYFI